jgi:hypothetical protein
MPHAVTPYLAACGCVHGDCMGTVLVVYFPYKGGRFTREKPTPIVSVQEGVRGGAKTGRGGARGLRKSNNNWWIDTSVCVWDGGDGGARTPHATPMHPIVLALKLPFFAPPPLPRQTPPPFCPRPRPTPHTPFPP